MGCFTSKNSVLKRYDFEHIKIHDFCDEVFNAKVIKVLDGDTITIGFFYKNLPIKINLRIYGIDSPEIHPNKNTPNQELHSKCGNIVKNIVEKLLLNKIILVKTANKKDKYGRLLATIILTDNNNLDIAKYLIDKGYAYEYTGGSKNNFDINFLEKINSI